TFKIQPPLRVLCIADQPIDAEFVASAIDPNPAAAKNRSTRVERIRASDFGQRDKDGLDTYACIFLLNVARLSDDEWGALTGYVRKGGGLVIGAGRGCDIASYDGSISSQLLPAQLDRPKEARPETTFGKLADLTHSLFARYGKALATELSQVR